MGAVVGAETSVDRIERVVTLPAPRERVWAALTEPERMAGWFGTKVELDLRPGGDALFGWGNDDLCRAIVVAVERPRRFAFRWRSYESDPRLPIDALPSTLVEFTLDEAPEGTRLTLVESGFAALPPELRGRSLADNQGGWAAELADLVAYMAVRPTVGN